jgi:CMP-N,N'-diacetyllegionaminic acid synthase
MVKKKYLAIIPAREGSKRLPNKNILNIAGKPLIIWTIEAALQSNYIDEIVLSTDSQKIADIGMTHGLKIPFLRPKELGTDNTTTVDVIRHAVEFYKTNLSIEFENVILLQPTSPLRETIDIDNAIMYFEDKQANAIISVTECDHSPLWAGKLPDDFSMINFLDKEIKEKRSQELPVYYRLNGAIYIWKVEELLKENNYFLKEKIYAYQMEKNKSIDIDSKFDFDIADFLLTKKIKSNNF